VPASDEPPDEELLLPEEELPEEPPLDVEPPLLLPLELSPPEPLPPLVASSPPSALAGLPPLDELLQPAAMATEAERPIETKMVVRVNFIFSLSHVGALSCRWGYTATGLGDKRWSR